MTQSDTLSTMRSDENTVPEYNCWIKVDSTALLHNVRALQGLLNTGVHSGRTGPSIIGVVKANGYGLGLAGVARLFTASGIDRFAVTTPAEGVALRDAGITADILVFAPPLAEQCALFGAHRLTATVTNLHELESLSEASSKSGTCTDVHLKIDTGMARFGVSPEEAPILARRIADCADRISLRGTYTHFATALELDKRKLERSFSLFLSTVEQIAAGGVNPGIRHCANSAAILLDERYWLDAVRPGTLLYGQFPGRSVPKRLELADAFEMQARVLSVKNISVGTAVGYGAEFIAKRPSKIAVLGVGFADGFAVSPVSAFSGLRGVRALIAGLTGRNTVAVTVRHRSAPVVGRIAMQTCMIDVTDVPGVAVGDVAVVPARRVTVSSLLPRIYSSSPENLK